MIKFSFLWTVLKLSTFFYPIVFGDEAAHTKIAPFYFLKITASPNPKSPSYNLKPVPAPLCVLADVLTLPKA